jgi:hypothetical protein
MATTAELKQAFSRSGLWRLGWSFDKAMGCELTRKGLECAVRASQRKAARQGNPAPMQPELI